MATCDTHVLNSVGFLFFLKQKNLSTTFPMSSTKCNNVKGTRDFYGEECHRRHHIVSTITKIFQKYNFAPLETPAFEYLDVLSGNYGDEGEKLLYKVLDSGNFLEGLDFSKPITPQLSEKGLRYDLTVPMMRHIGMHRNELVFPWRRYQTQPVWRADKPQRGRYREFLQCDADIVGSDSVLCEAELLAMAHEALRALGIFDFKISINHIDIFRGMMEMHGVGDRFKEIFTIVDKMDKVKHEDLFDEMKGSGFATGLVEDLREVMKLTTGEPNEKILNFIANRFSANKTAASGLTSLEKILSYTGSLGVDAKNLKVNPLLARGLSYYTGLIFEGKLDDGSLGSILGGGRYAGMLGNVFGLKNNQQFQDTAVGLSFGVDRIYDTLKERNLFFPKERTNQVRVFVIAMEEKFSTQGLVVAAALRAQNIVASVCYDQKKFKKYLEYADKGGFSHIVIVGEDELQENKFTIKDLSSGMQRLMGMDEMCMYLAIE